MAVWAQERIDLRFHPLDTTSCARSGDSVPDRDEHAMTLTHGDAKDHRPDLTQAVLALRGSQDGGVPFVSTSWEGHASDTQMFQERAAALMATLKRAPTPRSLVADAQLYQEDHAANLRQLGLITRIPTTLKLVAQVIGHARRWDTWHRLDETTRCWLVVSSQAALERAKASVNKAQQREADAMEKPLFPLHAQRCETPEAAQAALGALEPSWRSHQGAI